MGVSTDSGVNQALLLQSDKDGASVHSHLTELIQELLRSRKEDALTELENISLKIKARRYAEAARTTQVPKPSASQPDAQWLRTSSALFAAPAGEGTGVQDIHEEAGWFEWAGVGLPREERPRLFRAMSAIKEQNSLESVRFFGKVLGTTADYYVLEGSYARGCAPAAAAAEEGVALPDPEPPGTGLNLHAYFVAPDPSAPFVQLPDVRPEHVVAASRIKKFVTGDLDAPVRSYPAFPGPERLLLRAQIAHIAAATVLVPAGKLAIDEEAEEIIKPLVPASQFAPPAPPEMLDASKWSHLFGGVLRSGRTTNPPPPEDTEEAAEPEAEVAALSSVADDPPVSDLLPDSGTAAPAWSMRLYCPQARDGAVVIAKSNRWPGAYAATVRGEHANLYIGYGAEASALPYTPSPPPPISSEADVQPDQPDVTLTAENEVLKAIDEAKLLASEEEGAGAEE